MSRLFFVLLILFCLHAHSYAAERAVMKVFLNNEDKGDYFFIMTDTGRVLVSPEDMLKMGFAKAPAGAQTGEEGYVDIGSLSPGVSFKLDKRTSVLRMTAEPVLLRKNILDLSYKRGGKIFYAHDFSAFLNYGLTYEAGNAFDFRSMSIPLEFGARSDGYLGLSDFSYIKTGKEEKFVRLMTSIIKDSPSKLNRLIIGDFHAFSGNTGSGATLGGLSISRNFSTVPFFIRSPGLDVSGMLDTPSYVEIYANEMLLKRAHLSPGEFEFLNLPNINGAGEVALVVKDAFGREEKVAIPYYVSTMLLKPGLHDYSYNLGFKRKELGQKSFKYGGPAFLGYHRFGFSHIFTGGFRAEADKNIINAGPTATVMIGKLGVLDTSLAFSNSHGRVGYGFFSNYSYAGRRLSLGLFMKNYSKDYTNLALSTSNDKPRFESSVSLGFRQKTFGSLSVAYSVSDRYEGTDSKRLSLFYSRRLFRNTSFNMIASRTEAGERTYEVFAGLTFILGRETSGSLGYRVQDDVHTATATLQKNPPLGRGFGYSLIADRDENRDINQDDAKTGGRGLLQYRGAYGVYSAEYRRDGGEDGYTLGTSGGVVFINKSLHLTRPLTDGFALVKVGDFENVQVYYNNQEAGTTGKNGEMIIPGLISYYPNSISINDRDFPVNYTIPELEKLVSVQYRGGGMVKFDLRKIQAFTGRLYILEKGKKTEAEYWGLEVRSDDHPTETVVGKRGEFYMENMPAGSFPAKLFMKEKECNFKMTIPKSDDAMVDMGEVICEMD